MPIANSADGTGDKKIVMKSIFCRISTSLRDFQDFFWENQEARKSGGKYLCWLEWARACGRPGTIGTSVFSNISLKSPIQVAYKM